jgi:hypothetical protein
MVDEQLFPVLQDCAQGSPLLPIGITRQTPDFGPESAVTLVLTQAIDWPVDLVHSSALSQAAPSASVPENAAQPTLGMHVLDCSSRRLMQAPSFDGSAVTVPLPTSPITGICRSNSDSQSESGSGGNPAPAQHERTALQNAAPNPASDAPESPVPAEDGSVVLPLQLARRKRTKARRRSWSIDSSVSKSRHSLQPEGTHRGQAGAKRGSPSTEPVREGATLVEQATCVAPEQVAAPPLDLSADQLAQSWLPAVKPARRAHRIETVRRTATMFLEVHQHVDERVTYLARRTQRPRMITIAPHLASSSQDANRADASDSHRPAEPQCEWPTERRSQ